MAAAQAIDVTDVTKSFGSTTAVAGASLRVEQGQIAALVGPSGSGKTTLLRLVAGFEVPDAGAVHIGGRCVAGEDVWEEPDQRRIGMVFQDGALFPHLTVAGNLAFSGAARSRVDESLELVGLGDRATSYPHELSGGERQRIALARALAADPEVVLLDEPFAALDEGLRASLRREVTEILRRAGASALLVTHNQEEALSVGDVVAVMRAGRIEQLGAPEEVYRQPRTRWVARFLGDADVVAGTAQGGVVDSELGRFAAPDGQRGQVEIVLRPESLHLSPDDADASTDGSTATVVGRTYFGHDQLIELELASGLRLRSRTLGSASWRPGDRVRLRVVGPVTVLDAT